MTFIKTAAGSLIIPAALLFCLSAQAQSPPAKPPAMDKQFPKHPVNPSRPLPVARWTLTFNPYGVLEVPSAAGLGIGYRASRLVELWSETSYLNNFPFQLGQSAIHGFREIFQVRFYPADAPKCFIGIEGRYKTVTRWEKDDFYNAATQDTLLLYENKARRYFFGMALQIGIRTTIGKNKRFQFEAVAGIGYKNACVGRKTNPPGYVEHRFRAYNIDSPFRGDTPGDYSGPYLPCTLRLVYLLGGHLK